MDIEHRLSQSYLEAARAFLYCPEIGAVPGYKTPTVIAVDSLGCSAYIFSFMSIEALANYLLESEWEKGDSKLKREFPEAKDLRTLYWRHLRSLTDRLKKLCDLWGTAPIHVAEPRLWEDFIFLRDVRHFLIHPTRDQLHVLIEAEMQKPFRFASDVASGVISYLYRMTRNEPPEWIRQNTQFKFTQFEALEEFRPPPSATE